MWPHDQIYTHVCFVGITGCRWPFYAGKAAYEDAAAYSMVPTLGR